MLQVQAQVEERVSKQPQAKDQVLRDRVILVTGASKGIGRAAAIAFAAQGATVILLARTIAKLEEVYDDIEAIVEFGGPKPAIYPFNLLTAKPKDYEDLAANIERHFGRLDGILHNAAMLGGLTPIEHFQIEQWNQVLQVNLSASFLLTKATLPLLKKSSNASVLFTTASVGTTAKAYWGAYAVSKAGIQSLMQILQDELEVNTKIRVNCIDPGKIRTSLRASVYPGENPDTLRTPEEIVSYYVDFMREDNSTRGQIISLEKHQI